MGAPFLHSGVASERVLVALGDMLTSRQAPGLDSMLDDPDERVRRATAAAVVNIYARVGKPGVLPAQH